MSALSASVMLSSLAAIAPESGEGFPVIVWVAVPAAVLGALTAAAVKRAVLSRPRFRDHRPGIRTFFWIALADMVVWAVLWPALLAIRLQGISSHRGLWIIALLMVIALGYIANRYGFGRAFDPTVAGSLRGTLLAELFTVLMPVLGVLFALVIIFAARALGY